MPKPVMHSTCCVMRHTDGSRALLVRLCNIQISENVGMMLAAGTYLVGRMIYLN